MPEVQAAVCGVSPPLSPSPPPPPLPPPPSPKSPSPPPSKENVKLDLTVSGTVNSSSVQEIVARLTGVRTSAVTVETIGTRRLTVVAPGSDTAAPRIVLITVIITVPASTTATAMQTSLSSILNSAAAATKALGIKVVTVPTVSNTSSPSPPPVSLIVARTAGGPELVQQLLDGGALVDEKDEEGGTALMEVSFQGNTKVAKLLLDHGASVDEKDENENTALLMASYHGHTKVAKLLLDQGASVDKKDKEGGTALMWASFRGHTSRRWRSCCSTRARRSTRRTRVAGPR